MVDERRHFNRVAFDTAATFFAGKFQIDCQIVDISLHGVLLSLATPTKVEIGGTYRLEIPLDEDEHIIKMELELKNERGQQLGLACSNIDLDSITLLRRLVELNLSDPLLLERDFVALVGEN